MSGNTLLWIVELGGYPDFTPLYRDAGYQVEMVQSGRKAHAALKRRQPDVVVAEFNVQPDFRDRTSSLESLLAAVQGVPGARVIVFYDEEDEANLEKLRERFPDFTALSYPVDTDRLRAIL